MIQPVLTRSLVAAAFLCLAAGSVQGQQPTGRPTAEQARAILSARPELVEQLRQRFVTSGLTPEQIRARLRAEGYPEDLLDPYLPGAVGRPGEPTNDVYRAMRELGIADSTDIQLFQRMQSDTTAVDSLVLVSDARRDSVERAQARRAMREDVADSLIRADSGFNIFGLDVFRASRSRFEPNVSGPVDANYRLGPGDRLVLILTGDVEAVHPLEVTREGFVVVPQVGQIYVANLTLGQLEDLLYTRLGRVYSGVRRGQGATTRFSVSVSGLRSNQVFVLGEVERPGSYMISSAGTAMTALYAAGGPSANGSMRGVEVKRAGRTVSTLDLYAYLLRGDANGDVRLETGDIIFVPPRGLRVRAIGEVVRPATYELKGGETLADLIRAAGGFRADASRQRVQIERILPPESREAGGRDRVTLEVTANSELAPAAVTLEPGDVIRVFPVTARRRNTVTVEGNVWSAGPLGLAPGMTIRDAIRMAGGPKPDVYLGQVLVSRLRPDSTRVQLRAALRDSTGEVLGDFPLQEDDEIRVFALSEFRPDRFVAIGGAVRQGGRFPYRKGMTLRDLVLLAGGLEEGAYLREAEIARLPEDRTGLLSATTERVPLDSTYIFERRPGEEYLGAPGLHASPNGAPEVELRPYDNVLIMQQPNWELQRTVTIAGEVRFPGTYALKTRSERLSELIARAGGFTTEAYPEGTVFTRARDQLGRIAIDVPSAMRRPGSSDNLFLMHGDQIVVPQRQPVVQVRGFVNAPNVVAYVPGKNLDYYVAQAGGFGLKASEKRVYVTQPSGKRETVKRRRLLPDYVPEPQPGSLVVVPERADEERTNYIATISAVAQLLTSIIAIVITVNGLGL